MNNLLTITGVEDSTSRTNQLLDSINADIESFERSQEFEEREIAITTLLQIGDESENLHRHIRGNQLRKSAIFTPEGCDFIKEFYNFLCGKLLPF